MADINKEYYGKLIAKTVGLPPLKTAVVQPVDINSLGGALAAAEANIISPILVGSESKIKGVAAAQGWDISKHELVSTKHSHAAAEKAVHLVRSGCAEAMMKGKIHTDEFMHPLLKKKTGLGTERRMSHIFALAVPSYHKPLFITDAALNIQPELMQKRDIVQNAIDLLLALDIDDPKVAILSATEQVTDRIPSTLDATALCKMAERGQITGGILDGPLALDNAISIEAAKVKNIDSAVAGDADILVVPDLESGNMLYKQMRYLFGIEAAGIVLGAQVPVILTSRAAGAGATRIASCALGLVYARHQRSLLGADVG